MSRRLLEPNLVQCKHAAFFSSSKSVVDADGQTAFSLYLMQEVELQS